MSQLVEDYSPMQWKYADGVEQDAHVRDWMRTNHTLTSGVNSFIKCNLFYAQMMQKNELNKQSFIQNALGAISFILPRK